VEYYVGIDVSLELSSVCVVDGRGKIVKDAKVASEPDFKPFCWRRGM
jgi:transposase